MWENVSHPDAAVTQDGRVRSAVGVDVGLGVVNGAFHLPEQEAIKEGVFIQSWRNTLTHTDLFQAACPNGKLWDHRSLQGRFGLG